MLDQPAHILLVLDLACALAGLVVGYLLGRRSLGAQRDAHGFPASPLLGVRDAVFLFDIARHAFTHASAAAEDLWGRAARDLLADPRAWLASIDPDDRPVAERLLSEPRGGAPRTIRLTLPDGTTRWVRGRSHASRDPGGPMILLFEDVTAAVRERTESPPERRPSAAMSIIGSYVHEARGALQGLMGLVEVMTARFPGHDLVDRYLPPLREEMARLQQLTADLAACGADLRLTPSPLPVASVARAAVDRCASFAAEHDVGIEVRAGAPTGRAWLDAERASDLVARLVEHAIRHTPPGGAVIIEMSDSSDALAGSVELVVHAPGIVLSAGDSNAVFRPFGPGHRDGDGPRLALARRIAEEHRGSLVARVRPEGGISFVLRLPAEAVAGLAA